MCRKRALKEQQQGEQRRKKRGPKTGIPGAKSVIQALAPVVKNGRFHTLAISLVSNNCLWGRKEIKQLETLLNSQVKVLLWNWNRNITN